MSEHIKHILNTNSKIIGTPTLCGLRGGTVYDPTKSNCKACIERFKTIYPGSFEAWLRKNSKQELKDDEKTF